MSTFIDDLKKKGALKDSVLSVLKDLSKEHNGVFFLGTDIAEKLLKDNQVTVPDDEFFYISREIHCILQQPHRRGKSLTRSKEKVAPFICKRFRVKSSYGYRTILRKHGNDNTKTKNVNKKVISDVETSEIIAGICSITDITQLMNISFELSIHLGNICTKLNEENVNLKERLDKIDNAIKNLS